MPTSNPANTTASVGSCSGYRAADEHWRLIENWPGLGEYPGNSCLLELRARIEALEEGSTEQAESNRFCIEAIVARIEALEAAQQPAPATEESSATAPPAPAGGLVERVAEAMERHHVTGDIEGSWDAQARAVIREIAAATDQMAPDRNLTWERVALWLEREANQ